MPNASIHVTSVSVGPKMETELAKGDAGVFLVKLNSSFRPQEILSIFPLR